MPKITFQDTQQSVEVPVGTNLFDFCLTHDTPLRFSCGAGSCGVCCVLLLDGAKNVEPAEGIELATLERLASAPGARLACQLILHGDIVVSLGEL